MNFLSKKANSSAKPTSLPCESIRAEFPDYLDGAVSGVAMASIAEHLAGCMDCDEEFALLRTVQDSLADLGSAQPPAELQTQLLQAVAMERERGTHLSPASRFRLAWQSWLAPAALRVSGAFAAAILLLAGLGWMFAAPIAVQANDDNLAHLVAPHYLYSEVAPRPIPLDRDVPVLVDARVDTDGFVYDYTIVAGPTDPAVKLRVEENLLASVFKPATVFGVPVRGHVVMTYMGVSVRG